MNSQQLCVFFSIATTLIDSFIVCLPRHKKLGERKVNKLDSCLTIVTQRWCHDSQMRLEFNLNLDCVTFNGILIIFLFNELRGMQLYCINRAILID